MEEKRLLFAKDQYGHEWGPVDPKRPRASLLELTYRKSASPMYRDFKGGGFDQVGWVIGALKNSDEDGLWCELFWITPWRKEN